MNLCEIDWTATAAWVQALGSIGAIIAAIAIGNRQHKQSVILVEKQHKQNIELIELERKRSRDDLEHKDAEERRDLKELVAIVLDPLMRNVTQRIEELNSYNGRTDPLPDEQMQNIHQTEVEAAKTKIQIAELRDVFVSRPRNLLVHGHLIGALSRISNACNEEKHLDSLRSYREQQIRQRPFNGDHIKLIDEQPLDTGNLVAAVNNLHNVLETVGG